MKYLVFYDIRDGRRLHETAKLLGCTGYRIQRSFFSCTLEDSEALEKLKERIIGVINEKEDKVAIYPVCDKCIDSGCYIGSTPPDFFDKGYFIL